SLSGWVRWAARRRRAICSLRWRGQWVRSPRWAAMTGRLSVGDVASDQRGFVASGQPALTAEVVYAGCPHPRRRGPGTLPRLPRTSPCPHRNPHGSLCHAPYPEALCGVTGWWLMSYSALTSAARSAGPGGLQRGADADHGDASEKFCATRSIESLV